MRFSIEMSRETHAATRRDLTVHTDAIRIRPITTNSGFKGNSIVSMNDASKEHWTRVYVINYIEYMLYNKKIDRWIDR